MKLLGDALGSILVLFTIIEDLASLFSTLLVTSGGLVDGSCLGSDLDGRGEDCEVESGGEDFHFLFCLSEVSFLLLQGSIDPLLYPLW